MREKDLASASTAVRPAGGRKIGVAVNRKPTLGGIFRSSLIELMNTINNTDVHYIRCIKPNEAKEAWKFEGPMVLSQLRACGVLETVRISCAGYPTRWTYEEFALRYYMLVPSTQWTSEIRLMANAILTKALGASTGKGLDKYQLGLTKIFFRAGMLAFLENLRTNRLNDCAILIQKNLRAKYYRRRYVAARESIVRFQAAIRAYMARRQAQELRTVRAATTIQRVWRGQKQRKQFLRIRADVVQAQAAIKGYLRRKEIMETRIGNAAVLIQRVWRARRAARVWRQYRKKVVLIQSLWRGKTARHEYKQIREEARDLKQISYKLENKVIELTQSLGTMKTQNKELKTQVESYQGQIKSWQTRHGALEVRAKELQSEANQAGIAAARLAQMEDDMKKLQQSFDESMSNAKRMQQEEQQLKDSLRATSTQLEVARQDVNRSETEKNNLRQQLAEMQEALEIARRSVPVNGELTNGATNGVLPPVTSGLINLVSSKKPKRRSAGAEPREMDRYSMAYNPRPVSMAVTGRQNMAGAPTFMPGVDNIELELETLLADEDGLNEEVTLGLIKNLKIPSPATNPPPSDKEVLFPVVPHQPRHVGDVEQRLRQGVGALPRQRHAVHPAGGHAARGRPTPSTPAPSGSPTCMRCSRSSSSPRTGTRPRRQTTTNTTGCWRLSSTTSRASSSTSTTRG